ncbi:hypothetical protein [Streptomyces meridianus]|uniref:Secreted protein n=1 Tax=Streptomyces meridianus TaxID=2938945 RepID=A0ABT0X4Q3_9ACTN|nr:hypothetical protein [Streptomyces meridianus]MCM2577525.1 hypothetical protein [Streptomyces meridianus]
MNIDWAAIGQTFGVCLLATVGLVGLFTVGIVGTSRRTAVQGNGTATVTTAGSTAAAARFAGYAAFAVCTAAVGYGLYLITAG